VPRHRLLLAAAGVAVLLAAVVGALLLTRSDDGGGTAVGVVPSVVGLNEQDAEERLVAGGYSTQIVRRRDARQEGTVVAQQPAGGRRVDGGVVVLVVSGEPAGDNGTATVGQQPVSLPRVTGMHQILAGAELEQRGFVADSFPVADDAECGTVLRQEPAAGVRLRPGEHVRLTVSLGPDPLPQAQVPGLTGLAVAARTAAREFGFTVRTVEQRGPAGQVGLVLRQDPSALTRARELSQITLFVGR
jgi:eukaryotic-like serine/threonine-protein kinase